MSITEKLLETVSGSLKENGITERDRIQIGFSGGPDSTVLFYLLKLLQTDFKYSLYALYVDHGIRPAEIIEKEISDAAKIAETIGGSLEVEHVRNGLIEKEALREGRSIEDLAREYRYRIYGNERKETGASCTALGHNLDDNVETLIMRVFQGSGVHGLKGIPQKRGDIIRPLITVERTSINRCIEENGLKPVLDETNKELIYLRNRVRNELLPVVREIFPGYRKALVKMGRKMEAVSEYTRHKTEGWIRKAAGNGALNVSVNEFISLSTYERMELLYESWDIWLDKPSERLRYRTIDSLIHKKVLPSGRIMLSGADYSLEQRGGMIFWNRLVVLSKKSYLRVVSPGSIVIPGAARIEVLSGGDNISESDVWLDSDRVAWPLVVRSRKPGDFIDLSGGRKKIKKLYGEWKIPEGDRWKIPLVADREGILTVLGKSFGYKNRVAAGQRVRMSKAAKKILIFKAYME